MSNFAKIEAIKRLHWGFPADQQTPDNCTEPECSLCSILLCPHDEMMHLHHDGCPAEYLPHERTNECGQYCRHHEDDKFDGCQHLASIVTPSVAGCYYPQPKGWYCILSRAHDGPCAAVPTFWHALRNGLLRFWFGCKIRGM